MYRPVQDVSEPEIKKFRYPVIFSANSFAFVSIKQRKIIFLNPFHYFDDPGWGDARVEPTSRMRLEGHNNEVFSLAFSPNGRRLASGDGGEIRVWNTKDGSLEKVLVIRRKGKAGVFCEIAWVSVAWGDGVICTWIC